MLTVKHNVHGVGIRVIGEFDTLKDIYDHYSKLYGYYNLGRMFSDCYYDNAKNTHWTEYQPSLIIENDRGMIYSIEHITGEFNKLYNQNHKPRYNYCPGYKRHRGRGYRHPHTLQEIKFCNAVVKEDGEPEWRKKRCHLPNSYDDVIHGDYTRNWKKYRKVQYH